jgi:hypothetical protein
MGLKSPTMPGILVHITFCYCLAKATFHSSFNSHRFPPTVVPSKASNPCERLLIIFAGIPQKAPPHTHTFIYKRHTADYDTIITCFPSVNSIFINGSAPEKEAIITGLIHKGIFHFTGVLLNDSLTLFYWF